MQKRARQRLKVRETHCPKPNTARTISLRRLVTSCGARSQPAVPDPRDGASRPPAITDGCHHTIGAMAQERFVSGGLRVMIATNAFGMGIDIPDLRFVVHFQMPGSIDA